MNTIASRDRFLRRQLVLPGCALAATMGLGAQEPETAAKVESARTAMQQWVEVRQNIAKEKRDWTVGREMLSNRIDVVKRETASLRARIAEAEASITEADRKKIELVAERDRLKEATGSLAAVIDALEARTRELLPRLPDPIRERVKPFSQQIPVEPGSTKLSLSERFQNVIGLLNEVNKFSYEITVTSEVRQLGSGASAEVTALYVGIGQGYYVTAKGDAAGVGAPTADGWLWTPANEAATEIQKAIAILKNERAAEFVRLPIRIR